MLNKRQDKQTGSYNTPYLCTLENNIFVKLSVMFLNIRLNDCGTYVIKYMEAESEYDWSLIGEVKLHANAALPFSVHTWRYVVISYYYSLLMQDMEVQRLRKIVDLQMSVNNSIK